MSIGTPSAADVPSLFDVIINGKGYIFLRTIDTSLPFRTQRARYARTPTFVERSNVSNAYGDNAQSFFLTERQRNWSQGEQQKFFRTGVDGGYWRGSNIDIATPGQVGLALDKVAVTFPAQVQGAAKDRDLSAFVSASTTNLYRTDGITGAVTNLGAHGLGQYPVWRSFVNDETKVFFSEGGASSVRSWNGTVFASFSTSAADALAYLNNTLYGYQPGTASLEQYDTSGVATTLFTWKAADGTTSIINRARLVAWGGKLLIVFQRARPNAADMWIYDGTGVSRLEVFPENFTVSDIYVLYGVVYVAGAFARTIGGKVFLRPAIFFYDGTVGKLWQSDDYNTVKIVTDGDPDSGPYPALCGWGENLVFTDETTGRLMVYNPALGGVSGMSTFTPNVGGRVSIAAAGTQLVQTRLDTSGFVYPADTYTSSGYVISSLIDYESSLTKLFRSVRVEFQSATDGDGGSVDIAYQVDSIDGSYTTLATGVTSGSEVLFTNITGHSISIKVTLNRGTSTKGPVLKSMSVMASPKLVSYRNCEYILDLSGVDGRTPVILNDNETAHPKDGLTQALDINGVISSTNTFTVTDRFGSYTAIIEPDQSEIIEISPEEYIARVLAREV